MVRTLTGLSLGLLISACCSLVQAASFQVTPSDNLQALFDRTAHGDEVLLSPGRYEGNFTLPVTLTLRGQQGAIIDAGGKGHGLQITAPGSVIQNLAVENWGDDLTELNAGIFIHKSATGSLVENSQLKGGGFGIWVDGTADITLLSNKVEGDLKLRSADRGNGIHLFNVSGLRAENNEVWHTRDGIYIDTSNGNELIGNYLHDLRYGVHYMYSYHNRVEGNLTRNTRTGYALMQSKYLTVVGNRSENDANYGILMNYITNSTLRGNQVRGVQNANHPHMRRSPSQSGLEGKALFIYNSLFNEIHDNLFADSDMGIHLTAGSENNSLSGNAFIGNRVQVKYVATRTQDWSKDGKGNYWSDYLGWDMDGNGLGDIAYEPNDSMDQLLWKFPAARLLLNSPAIETLRWVQRQFPVFKAAGVEDSRPLMTAPAFPTTTTDKTVAGTANTTATGAKVTGVTP